MFFYLTLVSFLCCLILGGATKTGFLSEALLQLFTVPLLLVALWRLLDAPKAREVRRALAFCCSILVLPLVQLVPLPPVVWTHLPGRETLVSTYELLGRPLPWAPITTASQSTWLNALSLLPPVAVFMGVLTLEWRERRLMSLLFVAVAVASAFLGLVQSAEGRAGPFRFFDRTDEAPVGLFINRNHHAALLYCGAMLAAAWVVAGLDAIQSARGAAGRKATVILTIAASLALLVLTAVDVVVRSRAGVLLLVVGLMGWLGVAGASAFRRQIDIDGVLQRTSQARGLNGLVVSGMILGLAAIALLFVGGPSLLDFLGRFDVNILADARTVFAEVTSVAANAFMPFGAGLGSFVPAYQMFEKPQDLLVGIYANHAHNDLLELWLETGVAGPLLLGLFLYWLAKRARRAWGGGDVGRASVDRCLIDAAILMLLLLFGHSLVDYPLRTSAMMAVAAFACALLIEPASLASEKT